MEVGSSMGVASSGGCCSLSGGHEQALCSRLDSKSAFSFLLFRKKNSVIWGGSREWRGGCKGQRMSLIVRWPRASLVCKAGIAAHSRTPSIWGEGMGTEHGCWWPKEGLGTNEAGSVSMLSLMTCICKSPTSLQPIGLKMRWIQGRHAGVTVCGHSWLSMYCLSIAPTWSLVLDHHHHTFI